MFSSFITAQTATLFAQCVPDGACDSGSCGSPVSQLVTPDCGHGLLSNRRCFCPTRAKALVLYDKPKVNMRRPSWRSSLVQRAHRSGSSCICTCSSQQHPQMQALQRNISSHKVLLERASGRMRTCHELQAACCTTEMWGGSLPDKRSELQELRRTSLIYAYLRCRSRVESELPTHDVDIASS